MNAFRQFDGIIGDVSDPEKLKSVTAYVKEQEELEKKESNEDAVQEDMDNGEATSTVTKAEDADSATESDIESVSSQPPLTKRTKLDIDSPSLSESKENDESNAEDESKKKKR